jgi:hypothetical protein
VEEAGSYSPARRWSYVLSRRTTPRFCTLRSTGFLLVSAIES